MRAIVLAAGEGKRLRPYSESRPKAMVELAGQSLLVRQINVLLRAGISDITIVAGYLAQSIKGLGYPTIINERYDSTNMVASLMCAKSLLDGQEDVLVTYGDILFERRVLSSVQDSDKDICLAINLDWLDLWKIRMKDPLSDAETLKLDEQKNVIEIGKKATSYQQIEGQYMGIIKVSSKMAPKFVHAWDKLSPSRSYDGQNKDNMYMTSFLQYLIDSGYKTRAVCNHGGWLEVDTKEDLELYHRLYQDGELRHFCKINP